MSQSISVLEVASETLSQLFDKKKDRLVKQVCCLLVVGKNGELWE